MERKAYAIVTAQSRWMGRKEWVERREVWGTMQPIQTTILWHIHQQTYHFIGHDTAIVVRYLLSCDTVIHEFDALSLMRPQNFGQQRIHHYMNGQLVSEKQKKKINK
jgi:hypothetical protein